MSPRELGDFHLAVLAPAGGTHHDIPGELGLAEAGLEYLEMDPFAMAVRTVRRLVAWGGAVRTAAPVARIEAPGGRVRAVVTEAGERIPTDIVVTALDPRVALGELLDPPLGGTAGRDLAAARQRRPGARPRRH